MRVALYTRYSSEGQREASIEDQFRNCERYVEREGWQIVEQYEDRGISGTKDETGRDGCKAMLDAANAKRFDVLLVDDLDRLSKKHVAQARVQLRELVSEIRIAQRQTATWRRCSRGAMKGY
ncbi:MAG: recombinase family protein [Nitrospiraceae bacterium]